MIWLLLSCQTQVASTEQVGATPFNPVLFPPHEGPELWIANPSQLESIAASPTATLTGTAGEETLVITWSSGEVEGYAEGREKWAFETELTPGLNQISVAAEDTTGLQTTQSRNIIFWDDIEFLGHPDVPSFGNPDQRLGVHQSIAGEWTDALAQLTCSVQPEETYSLSNAEEGAAGSVILPGVPQDCVLRVHVQVNGEDRFGLGTQIRVREDLTQERAEEMLALQKEAAEEMLSSNGWEEAVESGIAALTASGQVTQIGWTDELLWWNSTDGVASSVGVSAAGRYGGGQGPLPPLANEEDTLVYAPTPRNLTVLRPALFATSSADHAIALAEADSCFEFSKHFDGANATVEQFRSIEPGVVHIEAHGVRTPAVPCSEDDALREEAGWSCGVQKTAIVSGETVDVAWVIEHSDALNERSLGLNVLLTRDFGAEAFLLYLLDGDNPVVRPIIYPSFFRDSYTLSQEGGASLKDSVVLGVICNGADNALGDAFLDAGVARYISFSGAVTPQYADTYMEGLYSSWFRGGTLDGALDSALNAVEGMGVREWTEQNSGGTELKAGSFPLTFGPKNTDVFLVENWVENGGFETDDDWTLEGIALTGNNYEGIGPQTGGRMLGLLPDPEGFGLGGANQRFSYGALPAGQYTLRYSSNLIIEKQACGGAVNWLTQPIRLDKAEESSDYKLVEVRSTASICEAATEGHDGSHSRTGWLTRSVQFEISEEEAGQYAFLTLAVVGSTYQLHGLFDDIVLVTGECDSDD